jgi:hypothetical protein
VPVHPVESKLVAIFAADSRLMARDAVDTFARMREIDDLRGARRLALSKTDNA